MKKIFGFTLVELVLVIAMLGILAAVLGPGLGTALRSYQVVLARRATLAQARAGMDRIVHEIRLIGRPSDILNVSSSTSFQFEYPNNNAITYSLSGTNLLRNSDVLASPVSALEFKYYRASGAETATASLVQRVQITFTTTAPAGQGSLTLRTNVFLRALNDRYADFNHQ